MSHKPFNPYEHHHHGPDCDHGHDDSQAMDDLDPAQRSLADALRVSFVVLKLVMLMLIVFYLFSGVFTVRSQEVAVRLQFGRIVGETREQQVLTEGGPYFAFPYPIEQVIRIPISPRTLDLNREFWFEVQANDTSGMGRDGPLNPEKDGSLITGDANIVHARWSLIYRVSDPVNYVTRVGDDATAEKVVRAAAEQAIVYAAAQTDADDVTRGQFIAAVAQQRLQELLNELKTGITAAVTLTNAIVPRSVQPAFQAVIDAESDRAQQIEKAQQERASILGGAAGEAFKPLLDLINKYELATAASDKATLDRIDHRLQWCLDRLRIPQWIALIGSVPDEQYENLWDLLIAADLAQASPDPAARAAAVAALAKAEDDLKLPPEQRGYISIGGSVSDVINTAKAYRTEVVEQVRAEVNDFLARLPQYQKTPRIVTSRIWEDAREQILSGDVETLYLPDGQVYLELNRDPAVRKAREEAALRAEQEKRQQAP